MNLGQTTLLLAGDDALTINLLKRLLQMGVGLGRQFVTRLRELT